MIKMFLAYPFIPGPLSAVKSVETLRRHVVLASEAGFPNVAREYREEIERRETTEMEKAA